MAAIAFDTTGRFILFVLFLAVTILFVANPETRAKIMETGEYVYERIKCILGFECYGTEDDTTAIDSTKALACAIDVTAYWSDKPKDLKVRLDDINNGGPKGLFDDKMGDRISSCTGETNAPPTTNAIRASSGSILAKLSEWSGGGGNKITGYAIEGDSEIPACSTCGDGTFNLCDEEECKSISKEWESRGFGYCKFEDGWTSNGCALVQNKEQAKAQGSTQADKTLRDNPGKSIKFGKTAVVCGKGIENKLNNPVCCQSDFSIQYREGTCIGDEIQVDKSICGSTGESDKFSCQVKAFELPQYVKGDILDYVAKWVGVFGEPKYLVYHETFPIGIEAVWTYSWEDSIISAAAVGGLFNLGGGALKSAWAGVKATSKGMAIAVVKREGFGAAISAGKTAATERLALEYGGEVAFRKILARQFSSAFHGIPQIEGKTFNVLEKAMLRAKNGGEMARVHKILTPAQQKKFMADMSLVVRSEEDDVSLDVLQKMADDAGVDDAIKYASKSGTATPPLDISKLAGELKVMKQTWKEGTLLSETEKKELQETVTREVGEATAKSAGMQALVGRSAKDGLWVFANLRALLKTPGYKEAFAKNMKAEAEELAKETYDDILRTTYNLEKTCGQKCAETYIDGIYVKTHDALKVEVPSDLKSYITEGDTAGALSQLKDDAVSVLKGVTGQKRTGSWYSFDRQKKVMAVTLAVSYLAQKKDANMEKYKSCGQGKLCLHIPKWFLLQREFFSDKGSTQSYGDGTDVKKSFNDLVSLAGFSGGATLRLNLASPCKADIQVKADASACKCETFYDKDKIVYRFDKIVCLLDVDKNGQYTDATENIPVNLESDGNCPTEITLTSDIHPPAIGNPDYKIVAGKYPVLTQTYYPLERPKLSPTNYYGTEEEYGPFSDCPVSDKEKILETLQKCAEKKLYDENNKLKNQYKQCYENKKEFGGCGDVLAPYTTYKLYNSPWFYDVSSQKINVVPAPLNILPSVDKSKPAETISVCENSWVADKLEFMKLGSRYNHPCITVTPDPGSMKTYSEAGFGTNFCAKSDISVMAKVESACFWGTIAVSFGAEMASLGAATPVVLYTVGSSGAVCEKLTQMQQKWPNNQF